MADEFAPVIAAAEPIDGKVRHDLDGIAIAASDVRVGGRATRTRWRVTGRAPLLRQKPAEQGALQPLYSVPARVYPVRREES